jgi:hypothetical protein
MRFTIQLSLLCDGSAALCGIANTKNIGANTAARSPDCCNAHMRGLLRQWRTGRSKNRPRNREAARD